MSGEPVRPTRRRERTVSSAVAVYIIVLLALQIFLLTVALDALLGYDPAMAWVAAGFSVLLELEFLGGRHDDPEIDDWFVYLPQVKRSRMPWQTGGRTFSTVQRTRVDNSGRFKAFTEPRHRLVGQQHARLDRQRAGP